MTASRVRTRCVLMVAALLMLTIGGAAAFAQTATPVPAIVTIPLLPANQGTFPNTAVPLTVEIGINPQRGMTGLGFRLFFDMTQVTIDETDADMDNVPNGLTMVYEFFPAPDLNPNVTFQFFADDMNLDGDAATNRYLLAAWLFGQPRPQSGQDLFIATFMTTGGFSGTTLRTLTKDVPPTFEHGPQQTAVLTAPPTPTPSNTPTASNTPTISPTPSNTLTPSNTPTASNTPTITNTPTRTNTPTNTPTRTNTPIASATPSLVAPKIPTLSGTGLALMVLLLLGIAAIYLARQRN